MQLDIFFKNLEKFLREEVSTHSNEIDKNSGYLSHFYKKLIEIGCLKLLIPPEYGGYGGKRMDWANYNILLAQFSGALLFLQAQHQFSVSQLNLLLASGCEENNIKTLLSNITKNNTGIGFAFAAKKNQITSIKENGCYFLSGTLPWVSGYSFYQQVLTSFDFDGMIYYALIPFENTSNTSSVIQISMDITLEVFNSTRTTSVSLTNWKIPNENILARHSDVEKELIYHPTIYNFVGASKALMKLAAEGKYALNLKVTNELTILKNKLEEYYYKIVENKSNPYTLRAEGYLLADSCAKLARVVCGSDGIVATHPLNRLNREIWQYAVAGYSAHQMSEYLKSEKNPA